MRDVFITQPNRPRIERQWQVAIASEAFAHAVALAFGPEGQQASGQASALGFTDARLLLFPVPSTVGVFAWVTCPFALERFKHDLSLCGTDFPFRVGRPPCVPINTHIMVSDHTVGLEERTFAVSRDPGITVLAEWLSNHLFPAESGYGYWREKLRTDLVVLPDDDFRRFVTLSTSMIARGDMSRQDQGEEAAVSYEEYLPANAILYALVLASPVFQKHAADKGMFRLTPRDEAEDRDEAEKVMTFFEDGLPAVMHIGSNATLGKGLVRTHMS